MEPIRLWRRNFLQGTQPMWVDEEPKHPAYFQDFVAVRCHEYDALVKERDEARRPRLPMDVYDEGRSAECAMEEVVSDFGVSDHWWFDPYDSSVELTAVRDGWLPNAEQRKALANVGIRRVYLSYWNGTGFLVNTVTGESGECSPRKTDENTSALVASLRNALRAATARAEKAEALLREAAPLLYAVGFDRKAPEDILSRIDALLGEAPGPDDRKGEA